MGTGTPKGCRRVEFSPRCYRGSGARLSICCSRPQVLHVSLLLQNIPLSRALPPPQEMGPERPQVAPGSPPEHVLGRKGQRAKSKAQSQDEMEVKARSPKPMDSPVDELGCEKEEEPKVRGNRDRVIAGWS